MHLPRLLALTALVASPAVCLSAPDDFSQAKRLLREHVYFDQNQSAAGDFYCGCKWEWVGKSGGKMDSAGCGFHSFTMADRADRLEWEHIMPISNVANQRQCWREGGREGCERTDPVFNRMEGDMFNLTPSIGTANALRSNLNYGMVIGPSIPLGACKTKVGLIDKTVEPRDEVKGMAARVTFYMADRYNLRLSDREQKVLMAWDRTYPVSAWEKERDDRIAYSMGHHNPFVTGERHWIEGYRPTGEGLAKAVMATTNPAPTPSATQGQQAATGASGPVRGNTRSHIYHLASGCPGYDKMSEKNRQEFATEAEAIAAGFQKAGNCR